MKVVIMAGGRGTRISELFPGIPKPLIPINGIPVLHREICSLWDQGFTDFILTVSYQAEQIVHYFGNGERLGVNIEYFVEETPLGSAGALIQMREQLTEDFLLLNADLVFDIDWNRFVSFHKKKGGLVTLLTHPNSHPYDSGLIVADDYGRVRDWLSKEEKRPRWYKNRVNAGIHVINPAILERVEADLKEKTRNLSPSGIDLDRQILKPLCGTGEMFCYDSPEYVRDMGTPERYRSVSEDFQSGLVTAKNRKNRQRAIFLDRDGTINKYVGFLWDIEDFALLPGVSTAIRRMNQAGYLVIVVTNQPVVARGEVTFAQLHKIHNKMETLLGKEGAFVDGIYVCPHHPDKGFEGEVPELKIDCDCRKPKPGLLLKAAGEFNIDLSASWMVGDDRKDILAGKHCGCHTALIGNEDFGQDLTVKSLFDFTEKQILFIY